MGPFDCGKVCFLSIRNDVAHSRRKQLFFAKGWAPKALQAFRVVLPFKKGRQLRILVRIFGMSFNCKDLFELKNILITDTHRFMFDGEYCDMIFHPVNTVTM